LGSIGRLSVAATDGRKRSEDSGCPRHSTSKALHRNGRGLQLIWRLVREHWRRLRKPQSHDFDQPRISFRWLRSQICTSQPRTRWRHRRFGHTLRGQQRRTSHCLHLGRTRRHGHADHPHPRYIPRIPERSVQKQRSLLPDQVFAESGKKTPGKARESSASGETPNISLQATIDPPPLLPCEWPPGHSCIRQLEV
jgi:hypothetical protein